MSKISLENRFKTPQTRTFDRTMTFDYCDRCYLKFENKYEYLKHVQEKHLKAVMFNTDLGNTVSYSRIGPGKFCCPTCYSICSTLDEVLLHLFCKEIPKSDKNTPSLPEKNGKFIEKQKDVNDNLEPSRKENEENYFSFLLTSNNGSNDKEIINTLDEKEKLAISIKRGFQTMNQCNQSDYISTGMNDKLCASNSIEININQHGDNIFERTIPNFESIINSKYHPLPYTENNFRQKTTIMRSQNISEENQLKSTRLDDENEPPNLIAQAKILASVQNSQIANDSLRMIEEIVSSIYDPKEVLYISFKLKMFPTDYSILCTYSNIKRKMPMRILRDGKFDKLLDKLVSANMISCNRKNQRTTQYKRNF